MATILAPQFGREVLRCNHCELVQFATARSFAAVVTNRTIGSARLRLSKLNSAGLLNRIQERIHFATA